MKLLLTSTGLSTPNIRDKFLQGLPTILSRLKIIFIPTASRYEEELKYVRESKKELLELGISDKNITTFNLDKDISYQELKTFDVIYVCGGNTFYLMQKVRECHFDKLLKHLAKDPTAKNKLYLGVSAGSILPGPSIEIAVPFDENDIKLTDFTGLNLTDVVASPHYVESDEALIKPFIEKYKVVRLSDVQAFFINESGFRMVR